jgi:hypothetical protein
VILLLLLLVSTTIKQITYSKQVIASKHHLLVVLCGRVLQRLYVAALIFGLQCTSKSKKTVLAAAVATAGGGVSALL